MIKLKGKNIALIFEKTSTRTRCAFECAAYDQGAHVTYLGPSGSQIGVKESMADTARVLGSSMMAALVFFGGMIMIMLGLIGEYIGRIYISMNNSPQYVIRERINTDAEETIQ